MPKPSSHTGNDLDFQMDESKLLLAAMNRHEKQHFPKRTTYEQDVASLILPKPPSMLPPARGAKIPHPSTLPKPTPKVQKQWQKFIDTQKRLDDASSAISTPYSALLTIQKMMAGMLSDPGRPLNLTYFVQSDRDRCVLRHQWCETIFRQRKYLDVIRRVWDTSDLPGAGEFRYDA